MKLNLLLRWIRFYVLPGIRDNVFQISCADYLRISGTLGFVHSLSTLLSLKADEFLAEAAEVAEEAAERNG